jgi:hypothetical protein
MPNDATPTRTAAGKSGNVEKELEADRGARDLGQIRRHG